MVRARCATWSPNVAPLTVVAGDARSRTMAVRAAAAMERPNLVVPLLVMVGPSRDRSRRWTSSGGADPAFGALGACEAWSVDARRADGHVPELQTGPAGQKGVPPSSLMTWRVRSVRSAEATTAAGPARPAVQRSRGRRGERGGSAQACHGWDYPHCRTVGCCPATSISSGTRAPSRCGCDRRVASVQIWAPPRQDRRGELMPVLGSGAGLHRSPDRPFDAMATAFSSGAPDGAAAGRARCRGRVRDRR